MVATAPAELVPSPDFGKYMGCVPKDRIDNIRFRLDICRMGFNDPKAAEELWIMCSRDPLFYVNVFGTTYDPRKKNMPVVPFITYDFQDDALWKMDAHLGEEDLLIEKSRDMGASWLLCLLFEYYWQFREMTSFLMGSRKEEFVDKSGDPKSLFWKIDFLLKNQPMWLQPNYLRRNLHFRNLDNGSTIDGESTNIDFGRGDRRTAIGLDEFASVTDGYAVDAATQHATDCRFFNSTPKGMGTAFSDLRHETLDDWMILTMHWTLHPEKSKGLYYDDHGKPRSPWYDHECKRTSHKQLIAQELDIDYAGSGWQYFDSETITRLLATTAADPLSIGEIEYESHSADFIRYFDVIAGRLQLWTMLAPDGRPTPHADYVVGCDISSGTGASNTVFCVIDKITGEQVAEWASPHVRPETAGRIAVGLAKMFRCTPPGCEPNEGALLIWEANGPGRAFGAAVLETGYRHIYYRVNETSIGRKMSDIPGWWSTPDTKEEMFSAYRDATTQGRLLIRSKDQLTECRDYVYTQNGIQHNRSVNTIDPSGAKDQHGDRPTAGGLCWRGAFDVPAPLDDDGVDPGQAALEGSFAWRREQASVRMQTQVADDVWGF